MIHYTECARMRAAFPFSWVTFCILVCVTSITTLELGRAQNLIVNPGFESDSDSWSGCGDITVLETSEVPAPLRAIRTGENAVRIYGSGNMPCGSPIFDPKFLLQTDVAIPESAEAVTVSFWYLREGDPLENIAITLGQFPLAPVLRRAPVGWNLYHAIIDGPDARSLAGRTVTLSLKDPGFLAGSSAPPEAPGISPRNPDGFYIDDFQVVARKTDRPTLPGDPGIGADNLLIDGDFESGWGSWERCGGVVDLVSNTAPNGSQKVFAGQRSLRVRYEIDRQCNGEVLGNNYNVVHRVFVPSDATELTVTLMYSRLGDPRTEVAVTLVQAESDDAGVVLPSIPRNSPTGWTAYHTTLNAESLARIRGKVLQLRFSANLFLDGGYPPGVLPDDPPVDDPGIFIDNIRIAARRLAKPVVPSDPTVEAESLLVNGGFEDGLKRWEVCGNVVEAVDNTADIPVNPLTVRTGHRALRISYSTNRCGIDSLAPSVICSQGFHVPPDARDMTLAFWYSRVGNPLANLSIKLSSEFHGILVQANLPTIHSEVPGGWSQFRYVLNTNQLDAIRGRRLYLSFHIALFDVNGNVSPAAVAATPGKDGIYLDDVRIFAGREVTLESPRSPGLINDGSRPILLFNGVARGPARMNVDGSELAAIGPGLLTTPLSPIWSGDRQSILALEGWLHPETPLPENEFRAKVTAVTRAPASGGPFSQVIRTSGTPGRRGEPLGCDESGVPCTRQQDPALDIEIVDAAAEPDGTRVAYTICVRQRYFNGSTGDPSCWIQIQEPHEPILLNERAIKIDPGAYASWSRKGVLVFEQSDVLKTNLPGIYEANLATSPPTLRLIVPSTGTRLRPSFYNDRGPVWSPNGRQFVTIRDMEGGHWINGGSDLLTQRRYHKGIFLHDLDAPNTPRQLLLADHADTINWLDYSPDGRYVLYSASIGNAVDIWWLDTHHGTTGRLTTDGASTRPRWRPDKVALAGKPFALNIQRKGEDQLTFGLKAEPGKYSIQSSSDLTRWTEVRPVEVDVTESASWTLDRRRGGGVAEFFRALRK